MPRPGKTILIIACGAIAREIHQIRTLNQWRHIEIEAIDANLHFTPTRIAPAVRDKLIHANGSYEKVFVAFADCGTYGELDKVLTEFGLERLPGLHCYATFAGQSQFDQYHDADPATFYLTDFLVRHFDRLVVRSLKLDVHPELLPQFFGNYQKVMYLMQSRSPLLEQKARDIADYLRLDYCSVETGFGELLPELQAVVGV